MHASSVDPRRPAGFKLGVARKKNVDGVDSSTSHIDSSLISSNVSSVAVDAKLDGDDENDSGDDFAGFLEGYSGAGDVYSNGAEANTGHYHNVGCDEFGSSSSDLEEEVMPSMNMLHSGRTNIVNNAGDLKFNDDWQKAIEKLTQSESPVIMLEMSQGVHSKA